MPAKSLSLFVVLFALLLPPAASAVQWVGTVVGIADGDTLTLLDSSKTPHRIRIDGIDAPERSQPYGQRARQSLADMAHGRGARAECARTDRYGRAVCRVTVDGLDVGLATAPRPGVALRQVRARTISRDAPPLRAGRSRRAHGSSRAMERTTTDRAVGLPARKRRTRRDALSASRRRGK
jgi:hypothetical protein